MLDWRDENNSSLQFTACESRLGQALEAKGFHEQAALFYAELGRHMHRVKHPNAMEIWANAAFGVALLLPCASFGLI